MHIYHHSFNNVIIMYILYIMYAYAMLEVVRGD